MLLLLLLFNTTRTTSGPPSTGAAIAMDGGVADTQPAITQAVSAAAAAVQHNAHNLQCCCCSTQRAHTLRTPKHSLVDSKLGRIALLMIAVHQTTQRQSGERDTPVPAKARPGSYRGGWAGPQSEAPTPG